MSVLTEQTTSVFLRAPFAAGRDNKILAFVTMIVYVELSHHELRHARTAKSGQYERLQEHAVTSASGELVAEGAPAVIREE